MTPEGISVVEIELNLPNAFYYLCWMPAVLPGTRKTGPQHLETVDAAVRQLGWTILAVGACPHTHRIRLLFETITDNLNDGLSVLLSRAPQHCLYLVQPEIPVRQVTRHIHNNHGAHVGGIDTQLPETHYGLFMGERLWADKMLGLLSRRASGSAPRFSRRNSLPAIERLHLNRQDAIAEAYRSGEFTLKDIAEHFNMHFSEISEIINESLMRNSENS